MPSIHRASGPPVLRQSCEPPKRAGLGVRKGSWHAAAHAGEDQCNESKGVFMRMQSHAITESPNWAFQGTLTRLIVLRALPGRP